MFNKLIHVDCWKVCNGTDPLFPFSTMVEECATCEAVYHRCAQDQLHSKMKYDNFVGRGFNVQQHGFQGLFPFVNDVPSVCTERRETGSGVGELKCDPRAEGEEDKKA